MPAENGAASLRGRAALAAIPDDDFSAMASNENTARFNETLAIEELDRLSAQLAEASGRVVIASANPPTLTLSSSTHFNDSITFHLNDEEYIKITNEGFFVKGVRVAEDRDIYEKFVEWLSHVRYNSGMAPIKPKPRPRTGPNKFNRYTALTGGFKS